MPESTYKMFLDYGALGVSVLILVWALYTQNKTIRAHESHMERLLSLVERNAQSNTRLAGAVEDLSSIVNNRLDKMIQRMALVIAKGSRED